MYLTSMFCKCSPQQKQPHITKSGGGKYHSITLPWFKNKRLLLLSWMKYKTKPKECTGCEVEKKGWMGLLSNYFVF